MQPRGPGIRASLDQRLPEAGLAALAQLQAGYQDSGGLQAARQTSVRDDPGWHEATRIRLSCTQAVVGSSPASPILDS